MSRKLLSILLLIFALNATTASADDDDEWKNGIPPSSIATSLPHNGDPAGIRQWLSEKGLTYSFVLTSEGLADVAGGMRGGGGFPGKTGAITQADLGKSV